MNPTTHFLATKCVSCSSREIEVDWRMGDVICGVCGVVQSERLLDSRDEVRIYEDDAGKKSSRTSGVADSFSGNDLILVGGSERDRQSLDRAHRSLVNRKVSAVLARLVEINDLSMGMNLSPSIKAKAADLFQQVLMGTVVRTAHKNCVAAACIYLACRLEGFPRLLDEVSEACHADLALVSKFQSLITKRMALPLSRIVCTDIVNRLGKKLHMSHQLVECAYDLCAKSVEYDLCESSPPQAIAAAALVWARLLEGLKKYALVSIRKEDVRQMVQSCYTGDKHADNVYKAFRACIGVLLPARWDMSDEILTLAPKTLDQFPVSVDVPIEKAVAVAEEITQPHIMRTPKGLKRLAPAAEGPNKRRSS